ESKHSPARAPRAESAAVFGKSLPPDPRLPRCSLTCFRPAGKARSGRPNRPHGDLTHVEATHRPRPEDPAARAARRRRRIGERRWRREEEVGGQLVDGAVEHIRRQQFATGAMGDRAVSDEVKLNWAGGDDGEDDDGRASALEGRNLAVSMFIPGKSGPMTFHGTALQESFLGKPDSGDHALDDSDAAY